ncbi:uncharacterized protein [Ptychodera flava]|uniref:uncharacterized protein n=1 Tax=Ptychodera flava TaxID=63121 RepID=UPI003969F4E0
MDIVKLVASFMLTLAVCRAAEWRTTPTDGQYEVGSEVILSCELDNLNINLPPSWALLTEGAATATAITDGTNIATEFSDLVELVGDQNNGEWNLKIKSISVDQQGEYSCTSLASDPQKQSATIRVWVSRAAEWRTAPTDGQYEVGSEVILNCELDNLNPSLPPSWALLREGAATATTITDGINIATEFNDLVELVGDQNNGEWNLKIKSISVDQQGEYSCTSLLSDPQKQSANIKVWAPVKSVALTGGEDSTTVEVPKPDETFTYTRTCKVDNVKPVPKLTWTYSITSDNNLNVAGELPEDFVMGPLPDDDLPEGGINNIKVDTTSSENGDSTSNVASVLTVNYTSSSDNDGSADPNLKIVATCKVSQDPYVGDTLTMESSQLTVHVIPRKYHFCLSICKHALIHNGFKHPKNLLS